VIVVSDDDVFRRHVEVERMHEALGSCGSYDESLEECYLISVDDSTAISDFHLKERIAVAIYSFGI